MMADSGRVTPPAVEWTGEEIAVIGMSCRFPGARDADAYWRNLQQGKSSVRHFSEDELRERGVSRSLLRNRAYVKAAAFLDDPELFDASFFGMSHREAETTDPQHRVLLECAWTALEQAGYNPDRFPGAIGIFAGATINSYLLYNLAADPGAIADLEPVQLNIGNASDFLATRIAYKLNLKGPCYAIQSACSTSLVAVHAACESLLNEECDMVLAGGVSVNVSFRNGYLYLEGGMTSPDGFCRPFDARAQGTIFGSGAGLVVLRRLDEALAAGDTVHAVIRGSAVNNDGSLKVGYTAPGLEGQRQVIAEALANAGVSARSIGYVEAHGTATPLGDPVEIQALTRAFREHTADRGFCAIGSVKGNIGHLDAAAGIAGLIKTVLALKHRTLPPSLHFESPNPNIDFASTPFRVNDRLRDWDAESGPRRAGVSAFGVGGTNAHVVLEEAPVRTPGASPCLPRLWLLSAKTEAALDRVIAQTADYLDTHPDLDPADAAFTLQVGRKSFERRRFAIAAELVQAASALREPAGGFTGSRAADGKPAPLVFLFPGQGAQFAGMGFSLYEREPVFRETVDRCASLLKPLLGKDLRDLLYPSPEGLDSANEVLTRTDMAQPALFVTSYALAQWFRNLGIEPESMVGHSIGEYVAACLAGVFSPEDALRLVAERARLMAALPEGAMIALPLSEPEAEHYLEPQLALAAVNGPGRCVLSGTFEAVERLERRLAAEGIASRHLSTSHAFHSPMVAPILDRLEGLVSKMKLTPPKIPFLSNLTGTWISEREAIDPAYWVQHARGTVRFADNLSLLLEQDRRIFLETGPGQSLSGFVRQHPQCGKDRTVLAPLKRADRDGQAETRLLEVVGRLWLAGIEPKWEALHGKPRPSRVSLPTYAFDHRRYWIEPRKESVVRFESRAAASSPPGADGLSQKLPPERWCSLSSWQRVLPPSLDRARLQAEQRNWLILVPEGSFKAGLHAALTGSGQNLFWLRVGQGYAREGNEFTIDPANPDQYRRLLADLANEARLPDVIVHGWLFGGRTESWTVARARDRGYFPLIYLARALGAMNDTRARRLLVVADKLFALTAAEEHVPEKALALGPCRVIPQEYVGLRCQAADLGEGDLDLVAGLALDLPDQPRAVRGGQCWAPYYQALTLPEAKCVLHPESVILFTGGLIEMGIDIARHFAEKQKVRLAFLEGPDFPEEHEWDRFLACHGASDPISASIRRARGLAVSGAEIAVVRADPARAEAVREAVTRVTSRFGPVRGLVYNARVLGERAFRAVEDSGPEESDWQFVPKVYLLDNLVRALEDQPLDFAILNSSLSSILGGRGMAAYAAANAFTDQYARRLNHRCRGVWTAVNWEAWQRTQVSAVSSAWAEYALKTEEALDLLDRILAEPRLEQVVVSTLDLETRLRVMDPENRQTTGPNRSGNGSRHPRPELSNPFQSPEGGLETQIAEVWQRVLGLEAVGVLDNFFELGGDSLLAIKAAGELKKALGRDIPTVSLYEGLTVKAVARSLEEPDPDADEEGNTDRLARKQRMRDMQKHLRSKRLNRAG